MRREDVYAGRGAGGAAAVAPLTWFHDSLRRRILMEHDLANFRRLMIPCALSLEYVIRPGNVGTELTCRILAISTLFTPSVPGYTVALGQQSGITVFVSPVIGCGVQRSPRYVDIVSKNNIVD